MYLIYFEMYIWDERNDLTYNYLNFEYTGTPKEESEVWRL